MPSRGKAAAAVTTGNPGRSKSRSPAPSSRASSRSRAAKAKEPPPVKKRHSRELVLDALEGEYASAVFLHHDSDDEESEVAAELASSAVSSEASSSGEASDSEDSSGEGSDDDDDNVVAMPPRPPVGPSTLLRRRGGADGRDAAATSDGRRRPLPSSSQPPPRQEQQEDSPRAIASGGGPTSGSTREAGLPARLGLRVNFSAGTDDSPSHASTASSGHGRVKERWGGREGGGGGGGGGSSQGKAGAKAKSQSKSKGSKGKKKRPPGLPDGDLGPPQLGRGLSWGSAMNSSSFGSWNVHSMYQSVMGRQFSFILESEDRVFWSTLLSGFSVLPLFTLAFAASSNTAMAILFTAVGDVPHLDSWDDWLRLGFSTLGIMIALRNLLVSMYEMAMDNTAPYPLLNPTLLSRIRSIVAVRPRGLANLITALHIHSVLALYGFTALGVTMGSLPEIWLKACHVFLCNTFVKFGCWQGFHLYEAYLKRRTRARRAAAAAAAASSGNNGNNHHRKREPPAYGMMSQLTGRQVAWLRRLRKWVVFFYAGSDTALLLAMAGYYLSLGEGQELLRYQQTAGYDPAQHNELERRVLTFNCIALVMANFASFGTWTYEVLTYGAHVLERSRWSDSIASSRQVSLAFTGALYAISLLRHGTLAAFFTLLVVFNGLSLSKFMLWSCIEVDRTLLPMLDSVQRHPWRVVGILLAYVLATRTPSDALVLTVFVAAVFWTFKVQIHPHACDIWAFGLTGLAVLMALHQACYNALVPRLDLFNVTLDATHLNVTSVVGPMSIELLPQPARGGISSGDPPRDPLGLDFNNPVADRKRGEPKYPYCAIKLHGLTLMHYASLSFLAYLNTEGPAFDAFFKASLNPADWEVRHAPSPRAHGVVFVDIYNRRLDMSVVSIRGTNPKNLFDVFQDMILFNSAFCWDAIGQIVPLVRWIPSKWVANLLYVSYLPVKLRFQHVATYRDLALHYHTEVQEYVERIAKERKVVLTGHSLGGGLAKIVSAKLGIPVVAISAPGIFLSHKILGVPAEGIDRYEVNLMSPDDIVPQIDRLRGVILQMHPHREGPLSTHNLGVTMCDLFEKCGLAFDKGSVIGDRIVSCVHP